MKKSRKLISLLMALAMIFALAIPAFAATTTVGSGDGTITITNAVNGETYTAYKMLDLSYNTETNSYSYTVADKWNDFFDLPEVSKYFTVASDGYVTCSLSDNDSELAAIAKLALEYANSSTVISAAGSVTADADGATITGLELGYYLVDTTLGTLCSIDSTDTTAEIVEKNSTEPQFDKTVGNNEQNNTASIGDTLTYTITIKDVENKSSVKVSDTLSEGLTLDTTSIKVKVNGEDVATTNYTLDTTTTTNGFTITFVDSYLVNMTDDIVITYEATINEKAVIYTDTNKNTATLEYGNQSKTDVVETTVYQFELKKIDNNNKPLSGAEFTLKDSDNNEIYVVATDNGYRVATSSTESGATTTIIAGDVVIKGLAAGTYTLTETKAPTGYNLLSGDQTVVINADGTVSLNGGTSGNIIEIVNQAGSELPSTGGMGTTLFYIFGGAMVLCAVVLLVTRRRMDNEQ